MKPDDFAAMTRDGFSVRIFWVGGEVLRVKVNAFSVAARRESWEDLVRSQTKNGQRETKSTKGFQEALTSRKGHRTTLSRRVYN